MARWLAVAATDGLNVVVLEEGATPAPMAVGSDELAAEVGGRGDDATGFAGDASASGGAGSGLGVAGRARALRASESFAL